MEVRMGFFCYTIAKYRQSLNLTAMKKFLPTLLCYCLFGFVVSETQAFNHEPNSISETTDELPPSYDVIKLQGSLVFSPGSNPIEAGVNDNSIYIQFNQNFGNVTVTVYNPYGLTIYTGVVNTAVQQVVVIPVSLSAEGLYTIYLDNASEYAEGEFEQIP